MIDGMTLVIGTRRYSSWSLRPWLALKQTGTAFETIEIALRQDDTKARIRAHSPSGKVPLLIHGPVKVWDSLAICEYLAETFPAAGLWPADREARAVARAVSAEMHAGFQALRQNCPMDLGLEQAMDILPEVQADIERIVSLWGDCRDRFGRQGPFLFGQFSIADAMYAPVVTRFATYRIPLDRVATAYCRAIEGLEAMRDWRAAAC